MLEPVHVIPKLLPADQKHIFKLAYPGRRVNNPEVTFVPGVSQADITGILARSPFHESQVVQDNLRVLEATVELAESLITQGGVLSAKGDLDIGFSCGQYTGIDNFVNRAIWARYHRVSRVPNINFAIPDAFIGRESTDVYAPNLADRLRVHDGGYGGVYAVSKNGVATWLSTGNLHTLVDSQYQALNTVRIFRPAQLAAIALEEAVLRYRASTAQQRFVQAPETVNTVIISSGFIAR